MRHVSSAAATHPGLRRPANEDAFCCRPDVGVYVVADGMGGHAAGEVASRVAVDAIEAHVAAAPAGTSAADTLTGALRAANRRVHDAVADDSALRGMATTAAAVLISPHDAAIAHVGDSRIYRWRDARLQLLTQDHSWVGEQVRAGMLTDADAQRHPWRNVVTRAIAGGADPDVDVASLDVRSGDRLLVCSDGLSAVVPHARLELIFAGDGSLPHLCDALIAAANDAGGPDNITVIALHIDVA